MRLLNFVALFCLLTCHSTCIVHILLCREVLVKSSLRYLLNTTLVLSESTVCEIDYMPSFFSMFAQFVRQHSVCNTCLQDELNFSMAKKEN